MLQILTGADNQTPAIESLKTFERIVLMQLVIMMTPVRVFFKVRACPLVGGMALQIYNTSRIGQHTAVFTY